MKIKHFWLALVSLFIISCAPETSSFLGLDSTGGGNGNGGGTGSGGGTGTTGTKVLAKINTFDDNGDPFSFSFTYANKAISKITTSDNSYISTISYNNGKISKVVSVLVDAETSEDVTITSIVSYNATGNIAKVEATEVTKLSGTLINTTQKVSTYVYNAANQVAKVTQEYSMAGISTQTGIFEYTYSGKNLTKMVFTTKLSLGPIPDVIVTTNYSGYDNKISPTSTLGNNYNEFSMSEKGLGVYGMSNNFTKVEMTESMMGTTTTETVSYTYDSQNYATSMTVSGEKSTFEYMSL